MDNRRKGGPLKNSLIGINLPARRNDGRILNQKLKAKTMANEKFTPGPWEAKNEKISGVVDPIYFTITAGRGFCVPSQQDAGFGLRGYMNNANANLIAAAPDLYKALDALIIEYEAQCGFKPCDHIQEVFNAKTALTKARGEHQEEDSPSSGDQMLDELHQNAPTPYDQ